MLYVLFVCMACPIFIWLVRSMSCLSGLCAVYLGVICLVCLSNFLTTSYIATVLCTCISMH